MHKTLLILRHEFRKTIKRIGFIILTLAVPVLVLLGIGIYHVASGVTRAPQVTKLGYVDEVGGFDQFTTQGNTSLVRFDSPEEATKALVSKDVTEYFVIPPDFISTGIVNLYTLQKELAPSAATTAAIKNFTSSNLLAERVPANVIARVEAPLNVTITTLTSTGAVAPQQAGYANFIVPGIFGLLLALSLVFSSTYVLQSLSEEKENRLMEVLLSSVSTRQLVTGKVLGLGAAGLVQVVVWVISLPLLLKLASAVIGGIVSSIHVPANFWVLGVMYFILGYFLYAVVSAAVSAMSSTIQEAQSLGAIYNLFNIVPLWFISLLLLFPNSPVWIVLTVFPFTAPVLVIMRLGLTGVPAWQLGASVGVLLLCIIGGLLLDAKLLRAYMLMYGKRPTLREIARGLRSR